ncbi:RNA polymerase sigma factor [Sphingomonas sp. S1-29]|uniref:RNA polymerase sigma factor n=1 Tax=Sphingomonas sp. S1-29 TaxID=2991074 RepID=UPI00223E9E69|nr:RNA polymerase sigma factor [Sphingomonas sp. S1-29]UZK70330.1 RNA polymerase sigma factor [Sphingomonas sp. S1-29]
MSDTAGPSDAELAAAARAGDQRAFAAIVTRHKGALHRLVARIIGDREQALDVVQESFVSAFGALGRYDPARPMDAWLSRIAINKARDWQRRQAVRRFVGAVLPFAADRAEVATDQPGPDRIAEGRAAVAELERAIAALPHRLREVLVLRTIEGLDQAATAQLLGISAKAVETRLYRARARLAELLEG